MARSGFLFGVASLTPVPLIALAALAGGVWVWLALLYLTLFAFALDELAGALAGPAPDGSEFPAADGLSVLLGLVHFPVLALSVWALAGGAAFGPAAWIGFFLASGLFFGQIGNSNAHELIHRGGRRLFTLGKWVYISLLFGHHVSAHRLVHHVHVGSRADPNTPRPGEGYYRFLIRAWIGSYAAGRRAEAARAPARAGVTPYRVYAAGALAFLALAWTLGGWSALGAYLALAFFAQSQLLLSDYVQHYGLARRRGADGRLEPVGPQHSWNAPHWFTGHMMLNAPRHSDHHAHPARRYPELRLPDAATVPTLPHSLPAMGILALYPPHWRRVMDGRAARWRAAGADLRQAAA